MEEEKDELFNILSKRAMDINKEIAVLGIVKSPKELLKYIRDNYKDEEMLFAIMILGATNTMKTIKRKLDETNPELNIMFAAILAGHANIEVVRQKIDPFGTSVTKTKPEDLN